jgi:hypothetical protein
MGNVSVRILGKSLKSWEWLITRLQIVPASSHEAIKFKHNKLTIIIIIIIYSSFAPHGA